MMQVVPAIRHTDLAKIPEGGPGFRMRIIVHAEPVPQRRHVGFDPERWSTHPAPAGQCLGSPIEYRIDPLVCGITRHANLPPGISLTEMCGKKTCLLNRQPRVIKLQAARQCFQIRVAAKGGRRGQITQPLLQATRRLLRHRISQPEGIQGNQPPNPGRADPCIHAGHIPAQAVSDQIDGLPGRTSRQDRVQIPEIIRKPVSIPTPLRSSEAAPIRRNHVPAAPKLIHDELVDLGAGGLGGRLRGGELFNNQHYDRVLMDITREDFGPSQLQRLVDIVSVHDVTFDRAVTQEMCLVRLGPAGHRLAEILGLAREFDARVVDASPQAMVLAIMDAPATISAFLERVQRFGIEEITRSGRIAMSMTTPARGARPSPNAQANPRDFAATDPFQAQADGFADEEAA